MYYVIIARYLERCADHACKIAEKVNYTITGKRIEIKKVKAGIALDRDILQKLDGIVNSSAHLSMSRSEVINVILRAFFRSDINHTKKTRVLVIRYRKEFL